MRLKWLEETQTVESWNHPWLLHSPAWYLRYDNSKLGLCGAGWLENLHEVFPCVLGFSQCGHCILRERTHGSIQRANVPRHSGRSCKGFYGPALEVVQHHSYSPLLIEAVISLPRFMERRHRHYLLMGKKMSKTLGPYFKTSTKRKWDKDNLRSTTTHKY